MLHVLLHDSCVLVVRNPLSTQFYPLANGAHLMRFNANTTFLGCRQYFAGHEWMSVGDRGRKRESECFGVIENYLAVFRALSFSLCCPARHLSFVVQLIMLKC